MVAIDSPIGLDTRPVLNVRLPLAALVGFSSALLVLTVMAASGFDDSGLRHASDLAWRFAAFAFFAAAIAGPICRLVPFSICKPLEPFRRQLIWSFCASYAVFLASLLLPNAIGGVLHENLTTGMSLFALFGAAVVGVMAYTTSESAAALVGEKVSAALLSVAGSFFWLTYSLTGLAHLSGPHRPDAFYGVILSLMIVALLLRFADRFVAKMRGTLASSIL